MKRFAIIWQAKASELKASRVGMPGDLCAIAEETLEQVADMARGTNYQPEQVVSLLRQIKVSVAKGKSTDQACRDAGMVEQTYYRWRKE